MMRLYITHLTAVVLALFLLPFASGKAEAFTDFPEPSQLPSHVELPDPLVMFNGERVRTKEAWVDQRRPELKQLFQHYMYGHLPPQLASVTATVEREDRGFLDGKATKTEVTLSFAAGDAPKIHLLLVIPNEGQGAVPAFVGPNFFGNHTTTRDPSIALTDVWVPNHKDGKARESDRGLQANTWAIDDVIGRGYGLATFYCGDVAPDHPGRSDGIFPFLRKTGDKGQEPGEWGAIAAWAWGVHRAVDYLQTHPKIDKARIAVVGHSRLGKAALLAGAFDERIALVIPHQAGCGGTAPSRGKVGESVKQINDRFPHWFDDRFKKFNEQTDRLPFDQHCLVALVAPRPVLLTNAVDDKWANPEGQFEMLKAAEPVYQLLGAGGVGVDKMPAPEVLVDAKLGYHIRPGKHSMVREDWKVFLTYADKYFRNASQPK